MASINFKGWNCLWRRWAIYTKFTNKDAIKKAKKDKKKVALGEESEARYKQTITDEEDKIWNQERDKLFTFWAVLMGHVVGFACIDAFATLQEFLSLPHQYGNQGAWLGVLLAVFGLIAWYFMMKKIRWFVGQRLSSETDHEKIEEAIDSWEEVVEDTENDAIALTVSFLVCQILRSVVTGALPNPEGSSERVLMHNESRHGTAPAFSGPLFFERSYVDVLCLWGLAYMVFFVVLIVRDGPCFSKAWECMSEERAERVSAVASDISAMTIGWAGYFGMLWLLDEVNRTHCAGGISSLAHRSGFNCGSGGMTGSVFLACCCTMLAYGVIICVRYSAAWYYSLLDNASWSSKKAVRHLTISILKAQGLLIGFGWEKSFDLAVEDISERVPKESRAMARVAVSFAVCLMVGLVWKLFLLPEVMRQEEEDKLLHKGREAFAETETKEEPQSEPLIQKKKKQTKQQEDLKKEYQEIADSYVKRAEQELARAKKLCTGGGRANIAIATLEAAIKGEPDERNMYMGKEHGQSHAQLLVEMKRILRRFDEMDIVRADHSSMFRAVTDCTKIPA